MAASRDAVPWPPAAKILIIMLKNDYRFAIEILTPEGVPLGQFPVTVDWEPAREDVRMLALRHRKIDPRTGDANVVVQPVWEDERGEPYAAGARLIDGDIASEMPLTYFQPSAIEVSAQLVEKEILKAGDLFDFKLLAFLGTEPASKSCSAFAMEDVIAPLDFVETRLADLESGAAAFGRAYSEDVPVFVPSNVLDEVETLARDAGDVETGGILIGQLHRDSAIPEIAVVITAQIAARHTHSRATALTFTAETWTAVRAALDLRRSGEIFTGWWHSHPAFAWCNPECTPDRRKICPLQKAFLSADDLLLHRTVFPKAFHVALLANNADAGLQFALFGWRHGMVQHRGFNVTGGWRRASEENPTLSNETSKGGNENATLCKH